MRKDKILAIHFIDPDLMQAIKMFAIGKGMFMNEAASYLLTRGLVDESKNPGNLHGKTEVFIITREKKTF